VFNLPNIEKIQYWKKFRESLEASSNPYQDVIGLWRKAPFVNDYLDPFNSLSWPDPWKLIVDGKFDNIGIALGILYTLQLTDRFNDDNFELYIDAKDLEQGSDRQIFVMINNNIILDYKQSLVVDLKEINLNLIKIWGILNIQ